MFTLGLGIVLGEFRGVARDSGLVARALVAVLVAVPALAVLVVRALDLPRAVQMGIVLMAISPGAPMALRRSIGAGGHRAFAPALPVMVSLLAVVSMPLSIAALLARYAGDAAVARGDVAIEFARPNSCRSRWACWRAGSRPSWRCGRSPGSDKCPACC